MHSYQLYVIDKHKLQSSSRLQLALALAQNKVATNLLNAYPANAGGQLLGVLHRGRGCRVGGSCAVQCIRPCAPPAENEVKGVFA